MITRIVFLKFPSSHTILYPPKPYSDKAIVSDTILFDIGHKPKPCPTKYYRVVDGYRYYLFDLFHVIGVE